METPPQLPPPGWYDDPNDPASLLYWDGTQWTENRAPRVGNASASSGPRNSNLSQSAPVKDLMGKANGAEAFLRVLPAERAIEVRTPNRGIGERQLAKCKYHEVLVSESGSTAHVGKVEFVANAPQALTEFLSRARTSDAPPTGNAVRASEPQHPLPGNQGDRLSAHHLPGSAASGDDSAGVPGISDVDSPATHRAVRAARFVEVCSYIFGALGVLLGLIIALTEDRTWRDFTNDPTFSEKYPDFWFGLSVSLAVAFQAAIVVMISAFIQAQLARRGD